MRKNIIIIGAFACVISMQAMQSNNERAQERYKNWIVKKTDMRLQTFITQNPNHVDALFFQRYFDEFAKDSAQQYGSKKGLKTFTEVAEENFVCFPRQWAVLKYILGNDDCGGPKPQSQRPVLEAFKREADKRYQNIIKGLPHE